MEFDESASLVDTIEFSRQLLARTLYEAATNIPFYRDALARRGKSSQLSLSDFPLIDKSIIAGRFEDFMCLDRFPDFVISSGGTVANSGAFSLRAQEEYEAVFYNSTGRHPRQRYDFDPAKGFSIDVFTHTNGYHWRKPPGLPVLPITLEQESHAQFIARLIENGLQVQGVRTYPFHVQGQCGPMRALTGYFYASGGLNILPDRFPSLLVFGSHTTRIWRERYAHIWGSYPRTLYGLSEFAPGTAQYCDSCQAFHFRTCWTEFLALDSEMPVERGEARLVLTGLFPFVQLQPRIRYETGDIVTLVGMCERTGRPAFRFRGRERSSVVTPGDPPRVLFSEVEVQEVLEQMSDVACQMQVAERRIWESAACPKPPFNMGYPRYEIESLRRDEDTVARIRFEVNFDPSAQPSRRGRVLDQFMALIEKEVPEIALACEAGWLDLDVDICGEQTLPVQVKPSA